MRQSSGRGQDMEGCARTGFRAQLPRGRAQIAERGGSRFLSQVAFRDKSSLQCIAELREDPQTKDRRQTASRKPDPIDLIRPLDRTRRRPSRWRRRGRPLPGDRGRACKQSLPPSRPSRSLRTRAPKVLSGLRPPGARAALDRSAAGTARVVLACALTSTDRSVRGHRTPKGRSSARSRGAGCPCSHGATSSASARPLSVLRLGRLAPHPSRVEAGPRHRLTVIRRVRYRQCEIVARI